jgi:hypothetical protein
MKKLITTEKNDVNLKEVSVRGNDIGKVNNYIRLLANNLQRKLVPKTSIHFEFDCTIAVEAFR